MFKFIEDRKEVIACWYEVSCMMSISSMMGGYYDSHMLDQLYVSIDDYQQAIERFKKTQLANRTG